MKSLFQSPERIFAFSMWIVSFVLASFLISLGGKVIADLPLATKPVSLNDFTNQALILRANSELTQAQNDLRELNLKRNEARAEFDKKSNDYQTAQKNSQNWLATRGATTSNPKAKEQDADLLALTSGLDKLGKEVRIASALQEDVRAKILAAERIVFEAERVIQQENDRAQPAYESAAKTAELKIFGLRLAITLPLLTLSGWMIYRKRKSRYWPLYRGFIIFSAFAFFFELVPYLPSYGGYVRSIAGIVICLVAAAYGIRWMQAYLIRRQEESKRNEQERRSTLNDVTAIQKMIAQLCPGCDRQIPAALDGVKVNNCVYCGLKLFDFCHAKKDESLECGVRKNAFYKHCPSCGTAKT